MRKIPLNARLAHDAVGSVEEEAYLVVFTHPETDEVIRLTTSPTERLSLDPLEYGIRSTWLGSNPVTEPFKFVIVSLLVPDDMPEAPSQARFVFDMISPAMAAALRSTNQRANVSIACVLASAPDLVVAEWLDLKLNSAEIADGSATLTVSREPVTAMPWPADRMTRARVPGLHP